VLRELDNRDSAILKALAISAIVFHNFFHVLGPVHENEFTFDSSRFPIFLATVVHPSTTIQALFAFFGHYGVQIFIFLSAYGLAKTHWNDTETWSAFMLSRVKKLYPMFILVMVFWALLAACHVGPLWVIENAIPRLFLVLTGVSTLLPGQTFPIVGPWWFIAFIVQFYAMWPLLRKFTKRFGWHGLVVLSIACYLIAYFAHPALAQRSIMLGTTPIGRMRIICLGIIAARYPLRIKVAAAIPALGFLILGSEYRSLAPLASLGFVIFALWLYTKMRTLLRKCDLLAQLGTYSLGIFLLNGIVRIPFIMLARTPDSQLVLGCASALVTLALSVFFHHSLATAEQFFLQRGAPARPPRMVLDPVESVAE